MACNGDSSEMCGGPNRLTVYQLGGSGGGSSTSAKPPTSTTASDVSSTTAKPPTSTTVSVDGNEPTAGAFPPAGKGNGGAWWLPNVKRMNNSPHATK